MALTRVKGSVWDAPDNEYQRSGMASVIRGLQAKLEDAISVKDFGATGDGVTDDRAAIQSAIDTVNGEGGGTIFFPRGTYLIDTGSGVNGITVYASNITLLGAGRGATIIKRKDQSVDSTADHLVIIGEGTTNPAVDITLTNMTIDGNQVNQSLTGPHNIRVENARNIVIHNVESKNSTYYGLHIRGEDAVTQNIYVSDCYIHDCRRDNLDVKNQGGFNNFIFLSNILCAEPGLANLTNDACYDFRGPLMAENIWARLSGTRHHGIRIRGTDNSTVQGRISISGFRIEATGSHTQDVLCLIEGEENRLSDGIISGGADDGIQIRAIRNHLVNLHIRLCGGNGVFVRDGGGRARIVNCYSAGNGLTGFRVDQEKCRLVDCEARSNTGIGVDINAIDTNLTGTESTGNGGADFDLGTNNAVITPEQRYARFTGTLSSGGNLDVPFERPFPNFVTAVTCNIEGDFNETVNVDSINTTKFTARVRPNPGAVSRTFSYSAFGY